MSTEANAVTMPPEGVRGGNEFERVLDGTFAMLTFLEPDPDQPGQLKPVQVRTKIRKVSIQRMDKLAAAWGQFPKEVAVYIDANEERVAQLTEDSFEAAMGEGRRLNFTSFEKWYRWQIETLKGLGQADEQKAVQEAAVAMVQAEVKRRLSGS